MKLIYHEVGADTALADSGAVMSDNEIDKLIASGLTFHDSGEVEAARDCYLKVLELDPRNSQALDLAGLLCMQCGESEAAKEFYKSAIEVDPDNPRFLLHLGILYLDQDDLGGSEEVLNQVLELDPDSTKSNKLFGKNF